MVSVVHICSKCKNRCFSYFSSLIHKDLNIHSHQYDFTELSLAEEIHVVHIILSFFGVVAMIVWF